MCRATPSPRPSSLRGSPGSPRLGDRRREVGNSRGSLVSRAPGPWRNRGGFRGFPPWCHNGLLTPHGAPCPAASFAHGHGARPSGCTVEPSRVTAFPKKKKRYRAQKASREGQAARPRGVEARPDESSSKAESAAQPPGQCKPERREQAAVAPWGKPPKPMVTPPCAGPSVSVPGPLGRSHPTPPTQARCTAVAWGPQVGGSSARRPQPVRRPPARREKMRALNAPQPACKKDSGRKGRHKRAPAARR